MQPSHQLAYEVHLITDFPESKLKKLIELFSSVGQVGRYQALQGRFPDTELLAISDGAGLSSWFQEDQE